MQWLSSLYWIYCINTTVHPFYQWWYGILFLIIIMFLWILYLHLLVYTYKWNCWKYGTCVYSTLVDNCHTVLKVDMLICISSNNAWVLHRFHLIEVYHLSCFDHFGGTQWGCLIVSIFISVMICGLEHPYICLSTDCSPS